MYITIIDWLELIMICLCHMCFWLLYFYREKAYLTDWQMAAFDINSDNILFRLVYFTKHGNSKKYVKMPNIWHFTRTKTHLIYLNISKVWFKTFYITRGIIFFLMIISKCETYFLSWLLIYKSTFLINNWIIYLTYNVTSIYECFACTLTNGYLID